MASESDVAVSTFATELSAEAFLVSSVMDLAMRSARSGSVTASASATSLSAEALEYSFDRVLQFGFCVELE